MKEDSRPAASLSSLANQCDDLSRLTAERDRDIAESSGRYLAEYLDERLRQFETRSEVAEARAIRSNFMASLLGAVVGAILAAIFSYFLSK